MFDIPEKTDKPSKILGFISVGFNVFYLDNASL